MELDPLVKGFGKKLQEFSKDPKCYNGHKPTKRSPARISPAVAVAPVVNAGGSNPQSRTEKELHKRTTLSTADMQLLFQQIVKIVAGKGQTIQQTKMQQLFASIYEKEVGLSATDLAGYYHAW